MAISRAASEHPPEEFRIAVRRFGDARDDALRHDEHMHRRLRIHVVKGEEIVRFMNDAAPGFRARRFFRKWSCEGK